MSPSYKWILESDSKIILYNNLGETKEYTVIYRNLYNREDSNTWARPAKMFFEGIDPNRKDNITKQSHRFEIVNDLTIDYTKKRKKSN